MSRRTIVFRCLIYGMGIFVACLVLISLLPPIGRELVVGLPTGWIGFLSRNLKEISLNWIGIGTVLLCSALALAGLHWICGWLHAHLRADASGPASPARWSWRWTIASYGAFWLLFCIVMAGPGLVSHVRWLREFDGPLYTERMSFYPDMKQAEGAFATALLEEKGSFERAKSNFIAAAYEGPGRSPTLWERHHLLLLEDDDGIARAAVIFPRDPRGQHITGFAVVGNNSSADFQPMTNLPTVLHRAKRTVPIKSPN